MRLTRCSALGSSLALLLSGCSSSDAASSHGLAVDGGNRAATGGSSHFPSEAGASSGGTSGRGGTVDANAAHFEDAAPAIHGRDGGAAAVGPRLSDFLGINGFIDDDAAKLAAMGNVREYHSWVWNDGNGAQGYAGYPDNQLQFSLWGGFWDFDAYYKQLGQAGALVFPCIQGSVDYLGKVMPPVASGADPTDPAAYAAHSSFLYQYAARYGARTAVDSDLLLAPGQVRVSGLNLLSYYENGNEPDATWVKPDGSFVFSPEATAAMSSADYDGHLGALGHAFGIKNADPSAKLVLAGLAGAGSGDWSTNVTTYLDAMRAWSDTHRGGHFPADVINVHDYCFGPDPFGTVAPRPGLSPEECGLEALIAKIARYRDANLPGKEVWLTEFGYDTHPKSRLRAPAIGSNSAEVVQGQWLVRGVLALLASGIDRAFIYISRDDCTGTDATCPNNSVQFATAGVLAEKGNEAPKAAWYFLATLRTRLGSMRYGGMVASGDANVSIARFYDATKNRGAYVLWSPTSHAAIVTQYPLVMRPALTTASVVTLEVNSTLGSELAATIVGSKLTLDVSETPTLVLVDGEP
jgi:hypothetical protein